MKTSWRGNKKRIIGGLMLMLAATYLTLALAPNTLVKKGLTPADHPGLLIVAHRGGAGLGLENTLSCIEQGLAAGADMIELDLRLTKDDHLLVCHDPTVNRTTNGKGAIAELTLAEIRALAVVDQKGNPTEEHLPTLGEVMALVDGRALLLLEIKKTKNFAQKMGPLLTEEIAGANAQDWVVVQSFDDAVLAELHALNPRQRLEKLIFCKLPGVPVIFDGGFTRFSFEKYRHITSFNIMHTAATARFIEALHRQGKKVKLWTVSEPQKAPALTVDGIITDRPDLWK